jgi:hypothetical protein
VRVLSGLPFFCGTHGLAVASQHPIQFHDDATLSTLHRVFADVWRVLQADDPFRDWDKDDELKLSVAQRLRALAAAGVSDADELRLKALQTVCSRMAS